MTVIGWLQIILFCAIIVALTKPLGWYMTRVFNGERTFLSPVLRPIDAGEPVDAGLDGTQHRRQECPLAVENARHVSAERLGQRNNDDAE